VKVIIPGGGGQIGTLLCRHFHASGHEVVVLSRRPGSAPWRGIVWDGASRGPWMREVDGADVVINLAGRSVDCRYHAANRREIMESRLRSTRAVGEAIARAVRPPGLWLQAGTATIYSHRHDSPNDDVTGELGGHEPRLPGTWRFSLDVAGAWERVLAEADTPSTRRVILRSAMTMSPDPGGVFSVLRTLVRLGLGGPVGDGNQFVSWIHRDDFIAAVEWLIRDERLSGPVNLAAPNPLPYRDFMAALRRACGMPIGLPAPRWLLEIGCFVMRTESELVLKSRRVTPRRLLDAGFRFRHPDWPEAAESLCEEAAASGKQPPAACATGGPNQ
jgi:uncharacterized protein (TIGR01777 family)